MSLPTPPPPQVLPIEAQWCLNAPSSATGNAPCIELEVARTMRQQMWGLMGRPPLAPLRGMWFPYDQPQVLKFWMHHTPSPLDMLFIRGQRVIAIEAGATPCPRLPCRSYGPDEAADGVVELAAGEASRLGIQVGSPAVIRPFKPLPPAARPAAPTRD
ncbi:MAG: DUF192 domain-containing protein [Cyanobacteria bacterium M_surface_10_m2_179]|nr:DUF192 domain-containing protein [Cyanobacteria bacterium M_surface_10_m2_179]